MSEGNSSYMGLAVALLGESEIKAQDSSVDIVTLTGASGTTADFLVCQHSTATTEKVVIAYDGTITTLGALVAPSLDVTGQVEAASLAVTGIGTADIPLGQAGITTYTVAGLTSNDVVILSPSEAMVGGITVDQVELSTLTVRNIGSETAAKEFNYLVISAT